MIVLLLVIIIVIMRWPKKQHFRAVLNTGDECVGHVNYQGKYNKDAVEAEIRERVENELLEGESIVKIYLG